MTITVNALGSNSASFAYTSNETPTTLIASIGTWLTSHGWTSHDAANNVYKSLCFDGITYKYAQLWSNNASTLFIRVYETWNATTHVGTNEAIYHYTSGTPNTAGNINAFTIDTTGGYVVVFASIRYMLMYTKYANNLYLTTPQGCVEWSTDYTDTTGVPFGWMHSHGLIGHSIYTSNSTRYYNMISPVRSFNNTGLTADKFTAVSAYNYIASSSWATGGTSFSGAFGVGLNYQLPTANNPSTNQARCYTIDVAKHKELTVTTSATLNTAATTISFAVMQQALGKLYDIKLVAGQITSWAPGDTCSVNVDINGFQVASGGTATVHHIAPCSTASPTIRMLIPV